jgi:chaperone BCS1
MLKTLFSELPEKCVVLLEDIDAAGAVCSRVSDSEDSDSDAEHKPQNARVTLSGLLNLLDGVASQEDRVLIMTTNHPEKLDRALTRPGRIDKAVEFQLADSKIARDMYRFMFGRQTKFDERDECLGEVESQANEFAEKIPVSLLSPAEIMSYLLSYRSCPSAAVRDCGEWLDSLVQSKKAYQ